MTEQPDDRFLSALREEPRPEFATHLAAHLGSGVAPPHRSRLRFRFLRRGRAIISLAAAAVLLVVLGLSVLWLPSGSQRVSAQDVLRKVVTLNVDDLGIQTYHLKMESDSYVPAQFNGDTPVPGAVIHSTSVIERWVSVPNRWRADVRFASQPFIPGTDQVSGSVSDGTTEWSYNEAGSGYDVAIGALRSGIAPPSLNTIPLPVGDLQPGQVVGNTGNDSPPGQSPMDRSLLSCYRDATIAGAATIAGRQAYMIDLGPDSCPPGYRLVSGGTPIPMATLPPAQQGRHTLWVDKQLYVVLKMERFNGDGSLQGRSEVTAFAVNQSIPESVFTFAPPPGSDESPGDGPASAALSDPDERDYLRHLHDAGFGVSTAHATADCVTGLDALSGERAALLRVRRTGTCGFCRRTRGVFLDTAGYYASYRICQKSLWFGQNVAHRC